MMLLQIIAVYTVEIPQLYGRAGVIFRRRRDSVWTVVECDVAKVDDRSVARPRYAPPDGTPNPMFRVHLTLTRREIPTSGVAIALQPDDRKVGLDPEQRILAPVFAGEQRLHYEFQRCEVLFMSPKGDVEIRLVAVDSDSGEVGTRTIAHFHTRYTGLVARCEAEFGGAGQLFPPPSPTSLKRVAVPKGEANLRFGAPGPSSFEQDVAEPEAILHEGSVTAEHQAPRGPASSPGTCKESFEDARADGAEAPAELDCAAALRPNDSVLGGIKDE